LSAKKYDTKLQKFEFDDKYKSVKLEELCEIKRGDRFVKNPLINDEQSEIFKYPIYGAGKIILY